MKRLFKGLAGSPLAEIDETIAELEKVAKRHRVAKARTKGLKTKWDKKLKGVSKSDFALRVPKTPDRQDPVPFEVWFDEYGQKHGAIDLDCAFQEYQFDPHLRGADPHSFEGRDNGSRSQKRDHEEHLLDIFSVDRDNPKKCGFSTGLLEGDREEKQRRPGLKSWWVFESEHLKTFLLARWQKDVYEAEKAMAVIYRYYYRNRTDEEIHDATQFFAVPKEVKQYRQYIMRQGAEQFESFRNKSGFGRRQPHGRFRGLACDDLNCTQCLANEQGYDYNRM